MKFFEGKRWFIWALVIIVVGLTGLVFYIYYTDQINSAGEPFTPVVHRAKQVALPLQLSQAKAVQRVSDLPDVKSYLKEYKNSHVVAEDQIQDDEDGNGAYWLVEVFSNNGIINSNHGFYRVYTETGKVVVVE